MVKKMLVKLLISRDTTEKFLLTWLILTTAGCNSGSSSVTSHSNHTQTADAPRYCQYLYINHNNTNYINSFGINPQTGALEPLGLPLVKTGNNPGSFYTHPNGNFVYVLGGNDQSIMAYKINYTTGQLTLIQTVHSPGTMLWGGALTPKTGKYLYVCNNQSNDIAMYKIDPNSGLLSLNKTAAHPNGLIANARNANGPNSIKITANLKWAYVGNYNSNNVTIYHLDNDTGDLTLAESAALSVPGCTHLRQILLSPSSVPSDPSYVPTPRQLYILCQRSDNIAQLNLDNAQLLIPSEHPPLASTHGVSPTAFSIEAEYKYIYAPNMQSNTIAQFAIESGSGLLSALKPPIVSGGLEGKGIYTNMGYAYVTNYGTNSISRFKIESNGTLTKLGGDVPSGGISPGNITLTPMHHTTVNIKLECNHFSRQIP